MSTHADGKYCIYFIALYQKSYLVSLIREEMIQNRDLQRQQVNTDTKGTCQSVRIIRVSVKRIITGLLEETTGNMFYRHKD